jgi:hypothetical protein
MALSIISQPAEYISAFGKNTIKVSTTNEDILRFIIQVKDNSDNILIQKYITAFDGAGTFAMKNTLSAVLYAYNALITTLSNGGTSVRTVTNHSQIVKFVIKGLLLDGTTPVGEDTTITNRKLHKAVNNGFGVDWTTGTNFFPYESVNGEIIRYAFKNQYIPICLYTTEASRAISLNGSALATLTLTGGFGCLLYKDNSSQVVNTITSAGTTSNTFKYILDNKCYQRSKTLYFINEYGGWDWYNFIDYETTQVADKYQYTVYANEEGDLNIYQPVENSIKEMKLYGRPGTSDYVKYLKALVNSPVVLDENGTRVRVLNNQLILEGDGIIEPEVTIQYLEENTIKY